MKEFLQTILKSTEDRIKNPFIGTFITSWIIFNWKPILFIIFSDKDIEDKISFIKENYNDIWYFLWFPLFSAVFYIAILPYISFLFEYITKFSHEWRNKVNLEAKDAALKLQIGIAKNEIKLEEEKTTFRERNSHNIMVENLQHQIKVLTDSLEEANKTHIETFAELQKKSEANVKELKAIIENYNTELTDTNTKLSAEMDKVLILRTELKEYKDKSSEYFNKLSTVERQFNVEKFINSRYKNPIDKVLTRGNYDIFEHFNSVNDIVYFSIADGRKLTHEDVYNHLSKKKFGEFTDEGNVGAYRNRLLANISENDRTLLK